MNRAKPVALITGAARRIGAAIAADLAAHGFSVAIHHLASHEEAEELCEAIAADGGTAQAFAADLRDPAQVDTMFASVMAEFGPVQLLVNNASIFLDDSAQAPNWDAWEGHFDLHVKAPARLGALFAEQADLESGLIVNIVDQRVLRPNPRFYSYALSKSALWAATQTMAQAFAPRIRVNAIGPGPTLANERQSDADFDRQVDGLLLKRGPALEEFGATVRYLWTTPSVTGQMIALDGGQHLAWETPDIAGIAE